MGQLGIGEALVSTLMDKGIPAPVERVLVRPPHSRMGKATLAERKAILDADPNMKRYGKSYDPRSAHEVLRERMQAKLENKEKAELEKRSAKPRPRRSNRQSSTEAFIKSMARSLGTAAGSSLGKKFFRGLLGSLLK